MIYLILLGAFQALVVFSIFIISHRKNSSDTIISWFPVWVFLHLGVGFFLHTFFPNAEIHKQYYTFITLIYPPLLWVYTEQLSGRHTRIRRKNIYLFLPALAAAIVYLIIAVYVIAHGGKTPFYILHYNKAVGYISMVLYPLFGILSLRELKHIPAFWQTEKRLVKFISIIFLMNIVVFVVFTINNQMPKGSRFTFDTHIWGRIYTYVSLLSICLAIGRMKVLSLMHTHTDLVQEDVKEATTMLQPVEITETPEALPAEVSGSTKKSSLSTVQQAQIARQIKWWMQEKALYKDAELNLDKLAAAMDVSRHHLSETLNQFLGQTFYQFINEYRIKEVVKLIDECKKNRQTPNILSLAFEAGFHSKSSFNQYFKKVTGNTPSGYLKSRNTDAGSKGSSVKTAFS